MTIDQQRAEAMAAARARAAQGGPAAPGQPANATAPGSAETTPQQRYDAALEQVRQADFADVSPEQFKAKAAEAGMGALNPQEIAQNDQMFGWGDELSGLAGALVQSFRGKDFGKSYSAWQALQQARRDLGMQQGGPAADVASAVGGLSSFGAAAPEAAVTAAAKAPSVIKSMLSGAGAGAGIGAVQGAGEANGDLNSRLEGAKTGAEIGAALGAGGGTVGGIIEKAAAGRATKAGQDAVPMAADIKAQAGAGYDAARATKAVIDTPALQLLKNDVGQVAQNEGLLLPSRKLASGYPRVKGALKALYEYAQGPMTVEQLLTLRRTFSNVADAKNKTERRLGSLLLNQLDDWANSLPQQAFKAGDGPGAMQMLSDAKETYARAMRTGSIEKAIYNAKLAGGGDDALRTEFRTILKSDRARRGFTDDEIGAMEKFVIGGPVGRFLKTLASGRGLAGIGWGTLAAGPVGAVGLPVAGMLGKASADASASAAANRIRAMVGSEDGIVPTRLSMKTLAPATVLGSGPLVQRPPRSYIEQLMSQ